MMFERTITRYGEPELVYIHVEPYDGNWWSCTFSRLHPSNTRMLGMLCPRDPKECDNIARTIMRYVDFLEKYYKA